MASGKHTKQGVNPYDERHSDERLYGVCELRAFIQMENGETVSIKTTEQIKGYVTAADFIKMLRNRTLTSYEGDGIERPIVTTREEIYPRKERVRKSRQKKKHQELRSIPEGSGAT